MANKSPVHKFQPGNQCAKKKIKDPDFQKLINKAGREAFEFLYNVMKDTNRAWDLRVRCAERIELRALGNPNQPISNADGTPLLIQLVNYAKNNDPV